MPWAQKDDGAWTDPVLATLSDPAYRLHDNCWTYAANKLTDGRISRAEVARVAAMFGLTDADNLTEIIGELVTSTLWTEDLHGYDLVGWLDQNRSRAQVESDRAQNRERQRRYAKKRWKRKPGSSSGETSDG